MNAFAVVLLFNVVGGNHMAKYNGSREDILRNIHKFSETDEQDLFTAFSSMGFPLEDEFNLPQPSDNNVVNFVVMTVSKNFDLQTVRKSDLDNSNDYVAFAA